MKRCMLKRQSSSLSLSRPLLRNRPKVTVEEDLNTWVSDDAWKGREPPRAAFPSAVLGRACRHAQLSRKASKRICWIGDSWLLATADSHRKWDPKEDAFAHLC
jgi:hypothetical protein